MSQPKREARRVALAPLLIRCLVGGILMGLANLVPGISGGTMLLAVGVYPHFVGGVAEVTTFQFKPRTLLILGVIAGSAALAIVLLAGVVRGLVIDHRWVMYSLFIGLTLGGVPVVWKLLRRMTVSAAVGCAAGLAIMALMAVLQPGSAGGAAAERVYGMLFVAGLAGASAMILPGISGGYLLLILGQYIPILGAIDSVKSGLELRDWSRVIEAMHVVVPVGIGVLIGVVGVSNLIKLLLERHRKPTLGVLLGLLLGAVLGLWPFQQPVAPEPGSVVKGRVMTPELIAELSAEDYPLHRFAPTGGQMSASAALVAGGLLLTYAISRIGGLEEETER